MTSPQTPFIPSRTNPLRRIGCISTSRADSGIYRSLWRELIDAGFETTCFAGGTHHDAQHGSTLDAFASFDGLRVVSVMHEIGDGSPAGVAAAAGDAMAAFGDAIDAERVDLLFVLGDRLEMLAATMAAAIHGIPLAHLHGGERTAGAYDDKCRDAITMMSDLHFAAMPAYAHRIVSMGIDASRVFCVGSLAIDALQSSAPMSLEETSRAVGLDLARPTLLVLFHPETLGGLSAAEQAGIVTAALADVDEQLLVFGVNADVGCRPVSSALKQLCESRGNAVMIPSVPPDVFQGCLAHGRAMVGNSSSGIIEAASLKLPVVNIGHRQGGRIRGSNVIDAPFERHAIVKAIRRATAASFRSGLDTLVNPYGDGRAAERICGVLRGASMDSFAPAACGT